MTLGHPRSTSEVHSPAEISASYSSTFDSQSLVLRYLERLGNEPEKRLGPALFRELKSLSREGDAELFWEGALRVAQRLEQGDRLEPAAELYQTIARSARADFPELSARAERRGKAMTGEGEGGARFDFLLRRVAHEASDPAMIAAFGAGSLAFRAAKLGVLSRLWSPGQEFFLGRAGAGLVASAAGLTAETPVFLFSSKLGRQLGGAAQDWRAETLAHELAGVGLTLLCLKGAGALSREAVQSLQGTMLAQASGLGRFAQAALPQAGMVGGIALARRSEEALGLRPRLDDATLLTDTFSTYLQFLVGARLADRALGAGFQGLQRRWDWQAEKILRSGRRISPLNLAAATTGGKIGGGEPSIQELMQKPAQSGSYNDGDGGGENPALESTKYGAFGFGKDTVMGRWFPVNEARPSSAVPMFTNTVDRIPTMLVTAYRARPPWEFPRTILLEPGLGALRKVSPAAEVTAELLNALTKNVGNNFPEKTPFRIMEVSKRRTFVARVTERKLSWAEEQDPLWARINRHSGTNEFEAENPLELYLFIESQVRQPKPSHETEYRVVYSGRNPVSYELRHNRFIERTLRLFRIAGKSFSVSSTDGRPIHRFGTPNGDWTIEDGGEAPAETPARTTILPRASVELPSSSVKPTTSVPSFVVVTTFQGLKDLAARLSEPSTPRRVEVWFEAPPSSTPANVENWQHIFRDLRSGKVLVIHDNRNQRSHTFQRQEDRVLGRNSRWNQALGWEPGIALSSRDVMDLFQQLQFTRRAKLKYGQELTVSILGDWEADHGKMFLDVLNQWGDLPFGKIEIKAGRRRSGVYLRAERDHQGKFVPAL